MYSVADIECEAFSSCSTVARHCCRVTVARCEPGTVRKSLGGFYTPRRFRRVRHQPPRQMPFRSRRVVTEALSTTLIWLSISSRHDCALPTTGNRPCEPKLVGPFA